VFCYSLLNLKKQKQVNNKNKQYILASKSPRRMELLKILDIDFTVIPSDIDEIINTNFTNEAVVMDIALKKAEDISSLNPDRYVLGFDTLVILDGVPLGKPIDKEDAIRMLKLLSGRTHTVLTGCAIVNNIYRDTFYSSVDVTFYDMSEEEIIEYAETKEPLDKAGAYGIQAYGARYIKEVKGDYFTIVGLPIAKLYKKLREL